MLKSSILKAQDTCLIFLTTFPLRDTKRSLLVGPFVVCCLLFVVCCLLFLRTKQKRYQTKEEGLLKSLIKGHKKKVVKKIKHVSLLVSLLVSLVLRRRDTKLRIRVVIFSFVCAAFIFYCAQNTKQRIPANKKICFEETRVVIFYFVCEAFIFSVKIFFFSFPFKGYTLKKKREAQKRVVIFSFVKDNVSSMRTLYLLYLLYLLLRIENKVFY